MISGREVRARAVVLATGGLSYPLTGSDGVRVRPRAAGGAYRHGALAVAYPDGDRGALGEPRGRS